MDGAEYLLVDAASATRAPVFDRERLDAALEKVAGEPKADRLEVSTITAVDDGLVVELTSKGGRATSCRLDAYQCVALARTASPPDALPAHDGSRELFARDHNLWLRTSDDRNERPLTHDGEAYFSYGKLPDTSLATVPHLRARTTLPPVGITWSPDGRYLLGTRTDERAVEPYPFVEWVPQDGSFRPTYNLRLPLLGDAGQPRPEAFVIDVASGRKHVLDLGADGFLGREAALAWSDDSRLHLGPRHAHPPGVLQGRRFLRRPAQLSGLLRRPRRAAG